ncbi:MAG: MBOAT family O-acyltransferase [Ferruginibacter sp.]
MIISIVANISLLAVFKYYDFFVSNINQVTGTNFILLNYILPIGLSFHTFQSMSYTIEVYRGKQKAIHHPGYYALYVMFYPQLVAGPIERPQKLIPQLFVEQKFSSRKLYEGLRLMAWGFFKKLVIADRIGKYADVIFSDPTHAGTVPAWVAVFFFSIQIYADFSGYSDIAIGAARCMGIDLSMNFNRPYQSINIKEFWRRWHISLSTWFRDYVYIPLGGNRKSIVRNHVNILVTFVLSALWHGAGWTFIVWGTLHGMYTLIYKWLNNSVGLFVPKVLAWMLTGLCVGFAWIFFRASSIDNAIQVIIQGIMFEDFSLNNFTIAVAGVEFGNFTLLFSFCMIGYMFLIERYTEPKMFDLNSKKITDIIIFVTTILLITFFGVFQKSSFIYFQF